LWINVKYWDWRASANVWVVDSLVPYEYCKAFGGNYNARSCTWTSSYFGHGNDYDMVTDNRGSEPQVYFTTRYYQINDWNSTDASGDVYVTEKVNQTWMVQNLNYKTATGSRCFNDIETNCRAGGRLYTYEAAKNACPSGWRLPTLNDWQNLVMSAGGGDRYSNLTFSEYLDVFQKEYILYQTAWEKLSSYNGWSVRNESASTTTNAMRFSAIPAGYCDNSGCSQIHRNYSYDHPAAIFWADGNKRVAFANKYFYTYTSNSGVAQGTYHSVRCIKNE
jgi:uncharacterized protein (TIGR02145 family)